MTTRRQRTTALMLAFTALCGCSHFKVQSDYDRAANFQNLRTYGWRPAPPRPSGDPRFDNSLIDSRVRAEVDRVLVAKGYTQASPSATPDFLVGYQAVLSSQTDVAMIDSWYGYRGGGFLHPHLDVHSYDEGTLLIDVIDPGAMKLLWRGSATGVVREKATVQKREERAAEVVSKILAKFPPKP